nr:unnamed protein product [Digitaria exilis]
MKPQVLLVAMAVLAVFAALPLGRAGEWPCCDTCGACTRSFPPQCLCRDTSLDGCHPKCVKSSEDIGEHGKDDATTAAGAWPCCDTCGTCTRSLPPRCTCMDTAPSGCNAACKSCVKTSLGGSNIFRCADRVANLCKRRCTPAA